MQASELQEHDLASNKSTLLFTNSIVRPGGFDNISS